MTSTNTSILDLDALLDQSMDQVETLPEYISPAPGVYMLVVDKADIQEPKKPKAGEEPKPARLRITYRLASTIQIESNEPPFPDGSLFSEGFQATEDGLKYYKRRSMAILNVTDLGDAKLRDVMDTLAGTEFKAVISVKKTTGSDGREYENINVRPVHEELPG